MNVISFEPSGRRFRGDRTESRRPRLAFRSLAEPASALSAPTVSASALTGSASALTVSVINGFVARVSAYARAPAIRVVGRDIRVPFVVMARLAGDVQAAVDISHFEHLIAQNDLLPNSRA
jgi:hypothetical protein